jgi:hypothetical protein
MLLRCADWLLFPTFHLGVLHNFQHLRNSSQLSKNWNNLVTYRSMLMGTVRLHRPDVALGTKYLPFISFLATLVAAGLTLALFTPQPAIHHPHQFHQLEGWMVRVVCVWRGNTFSLHFCPIVNCCDEQLCANTLTQLGFFWGGDEISSNFDLNKMMSTYTKDFSWGNKWPEFARFWRKIN